MRINVLLGLDEDLAAHADVDEHLRRQHTGDTDADEPVHIVAGLDADVDDADDDGRQQNEDRHAAEHAQLLTDGGEDQVGVLRGSSIRSIQPEHTDIRNKQANNRRKINAPFFFTSPIRVIYTILL